MGIRGHEKTTVDWGSSMVELLLNKCKALDSTLAKPDNNNEHQGYSPILEMHFNAIHESFFSSCP